MNVRFWRIRRTFWSKSFRSPAREKPDALLIAGDVYDKSAPSAEAVALLDDFLARLSQMGQKTFIISGNHDSAERVAFAGRLVRASGIYLSPVYAGTVVPITLEDAFGAVDFFLLPFLKPASVRRFYPEEDIPPLRRPSLAPSRIHAHRSFPAQRSAGAPVCGGRAALRCGGIRRGRRGQRIARGIRSLRLCGARALARRAERAGRARALLRFAAQIFIFRGPAAKVPHRGGTG